MIPVDGTLLLMIFESKVYCEGKLVVCPILLSPLCLLAKLLMLGFMLKMLRLLTF